MITRQISLDTIRAAAEHVYEAAVRTPLVPLPTQPGATGDLSQARDAAAHRLLQDPRRVQRRAPALADQLAGGVWTVSAGNAAQGVALAALKRKAPCSVMVMDTAPETKLQAIQRFGARIVKASYDECWRTVEQHGSDRMAGLFVHPFDDDFFISGNGTIGLEILEDLPDVDAVVAPIGGGGLLAGMACAIRGRQPEDERLRRGTGDRRPALGLVCGWAGELLRRMARVVRRRRRRPLGARRRCGRCSRTGSTNHWWSSLDDAAAAMRLTADRVHVIAEGAAACAIAAALSPAMAAKGHRKVVAVVSGGNIDLSRFAQLVGACPAKNL